jgi:hypothetical protein
VTTLAAANRNSQLKLRAVMLRSLLGLWPTLAVDSLDATFPRWALAAGQLVIAQHATSVQISAEYLQAQRFASGVAGAPVIVRATPPAAELVATALHVTSVVAVKRSMSAGQSAPQAMANAFVQSSGAASRMVLDGGRETITRSAIADPRARGWARVTSTRPCSFCEMLAGRGAVYKEDTADFQAHDHCACSAAVEYR